MAVFVVAGPLSEGSFCARLVFPLRHDRVRDTAHSAIGRHPTTRAGLSTWLVDGALPVSDLLETLEIREIPGEEDGFTTVAGLVLAHLHRIPVPGDHFVAGSWKFEVKAMDGNRIDKVHIVTAPENASPSTR